jgi:hypothetical protein
MSLLVTFNGANYTLPTTGEVGWGSNLDSYLVAIAAGCLQKTGGSFTLSAETDFGASFGLKSLYYKSRSSNIASTGILRLGVADSIDWRNNANSADLSLAINGSDQLTYNGVAIGGSGIYTANRAVITDGSGNLGVSATTSTELGYVSGVTSAIQTQLNTKIDTAGTGLSKTGTTLALSIPVSVANGGTNASSFTAYSVICAGTTPTGAFQNVSGVGLSGQVLTSSGPAALPTWTNVAGTGTVNSGTAGRLSLYPASTNTVSDTYIQNSHNIVILIATQATRSSNLTLTIPNPGDAVTAANFVLSEGTQTVNTALTLGSILTAANGNATNPGINLGDVLTGFYRSALNEISFSSNSIQQFKFTSIGDIVGVGSGVLNWSNTKYQVSGNQMYPITNIVQVTTTSVTTTSSTSYVTTALSAVITPKFSTSKVLVTISTMVQISQSDSAYLTIRRNGINIASVDSFTFATNPTGTAISYPVSISFYDNPASTSAQTYTLMLKSFGGNSVSVNVGSNTGVIILTEIAQ